MYVLARLVPTYRGVLCASKTCTCVDDGQSGGRPCGTTQETGYDVGCRRGRPCGRSRTINFSGSIELPTEMMGSL